MIKGLVERRVARRVPFHYEIDIHLQKDDLSQVVANATDISAGGIQFSIPWGTEILKEGDVVELHFDLPIIGKTIIHAEIRHLRFGIDTDQKRYVFYGAKFIDLNLETWNYVLDFCQVQTEPDEGTPKPEVHHEIERKDIRIPTTLMAKLQLPEGKSVYGLVEDISFGGVRLRIPIPIGVDTPVELQLLMKDMHLTINGLCVWSSEFNSEGRDYCAGIFFNRLDPEKFALLRNLIFKLAKSQT